MSTPTAFHLELPDKTTLLKVPKLIPAAPSSCGNTPVKRSNERLYCNVLIKIVCKFFNSCAIFLFAFVAGLPYIVCPNCCLRSASPSAITYGFIIDG